MATYTSTGKHARALCYNCTANDSPAKCVQTLISLVCKSKEDYADKPSRGYSTSMDSFKFLTCKGKKLFEKHFRFHIIT